MPLTPADARRIREHVATLTADEVAEAVDLYDDVQDVLWHLLGVLDDRLVDLEDERR